MSEDATTSALKGCSFKKSSVLLFKATGSFFAVRNPEYLSKTETTDVKSGAIFLSAYFDMKVIPIMAITIHGIRTVKLKGDVFLLVNTFFEHSFTKYHPAFVLFLGSFATTHR
jgi:hypothetical protein